MKKVFYVLFFAVWILTCSKKVTDRGNGDANEDEEICTIHADGSGFQRLTDNQVMINSDGTDNHTITPGYFPSTFLCHSPIFSQDDSKIYFIGQWWEDGGNEIKNQLHKNVSWSNL